MNDILRCTLCGWEQAVSAEDPDATVDDAVHHAATSHAFDVRLGLPKAVELIPGAALMPDPTEILADWKAKTDAATPGEWEHDVHRSGGGLERSYDVHRILPDNLAIVGNGMDAEFIAVSRTAMPALLSAVESVLALHTPVYPHPGPDVACFHCAAPEPTPDDGTWVPYPCETVRALESALGGGDDE